ncbi:hypothetical protein [Clostridium lundense]|uniref:hypothetical protein n=1 Tax=Clostridium lundense TaxID=319475 RepID=UPI000686827E|nr:hypothetical protein [Clostridium lundense]
MFLFNKRDVYIGYSLEELSKIREILAKEGIKYTYKVINHSGEWAGRGTTRGKFGSFGMKMDYEKQYVISVNKNDYEKAKYLVNSILHP